MGSVSGLFLGQLAYQHLGNRLLLLDTLIFIFALSFTYVFTIKLKYDVKVTWRTLEEAALL
jgi:hypothetical protein